LWFFGIIRSTSRKFVRRCEGHRLRLGRDCPSRRLDAAERPLELDKYGNGGFGRQLRHDSSWIRLEMEASGWRSTWRRSISPNRAHVASQGAPMASTARAGRFPVCHFLCQTNLQCLGQLDPAKLPAGAAITWKALPPCCSRDHRSHRPRGHRSRRRPPRRVTG
jgi:hypothetical protein